MFFTTPSKLRAHGMLGMNRRNVAYISRYNNRRFYPLVDNKLKTKLVAEKARAATPRLLAVVEQQHQVNRLQQVLELYSEFVIKPAQGSQGKGILVITGRDGDHYLKPSGERVSPAEISRHASNILSGLYSLGGKPDVAMVESLVHFDHVFDEFSHEGVPDIRVIIFKGFPVMAMMRCSTKASDGKANLHQGAVGVGIDLASGKALHAVQHDRPVSHHPDTGAHFATLQVPHWDRILPLAASSYEMTGLGYIGADIVLDVHQGPMILELNARPGLAVQIANGTGLLPRLRAIEALSHPDMEVAERVTWAVEQFGERPAG
ncbi:alpha-L-glutamate ligase-like protein [Aestuariirhabdus litorea]|uniref:Alpha-L-glutamate ligase-like protein n=1 Tax=Aestuariirhabdus litorea TaxID=2528527 RepID=A0A3P3VQW3_9GAMM|nr:alpha-L-glutamate ligase-like protein [Aestuariirhabdus litorea]RRJ84056.1 alpha-L-glutamate ligase-like protein [Aestuariirhabdus litorea]RWW97276.1 alpha-L-glutamate ligase-like protein [Endozoicomonadaceae bacterium GTF-13]